MDEIQRFDYSSFESLPDFDDQLITMETTLSSDDYMCNTIEAIRLNEWMNAIDFASSSTMIDSKHSGGGVNGEEQQTLDDRLQYDQRWKNEEEFTRFSTCDLEASQRESLAWSDHDHPVLHSMDVLNSCGISCPERKSDLPDLGQRDYLFSDGSNHESNQGLGFCKSARSVVGRKLISERKRCTKVNQSLYTLRSLVPFITKVTLHFSGRQ
jgi:hypothetical protein